MKQLQLHAASCTRSECQSADAKVKKVSKLKETARRKQSSCTSKKQAWKTQKKKKDEEEEDDDEAMARSKSYTQQVSKCRRRSKNV